MPYKVNEIASSPKERVFQQLCSCRALLRIHCEAASNQSAEVRVSLGHCILFVTPSVNKATKVCLFFGRSKGIVSCNTGEEHATKLPDVQRLAVVAMLGKHLRRPESLEQAVGARWNVLS
jgi:hypothetical protein